MTGFYRPDPELMNAYADVLSKATRAIAAAKRAQQYLELADIDGLEKQLMHTLELQREHIKKTVEAKATEDLKREAAGWRSPYRSPGG